ncbi:MAG: O-succinylhomoserine sulfhydrylase [Betaproteobacteria bacterium]|nr:O-succinylhomoserine sulfhydrylase [Betaproteobacteria bacterium]PWB61074.1 MAG: O-succinylhomoserine sulfhydrylase [Betaproteobacteria bacterium]
MTDDYKPDTLGVRAGGLRSDFREHSEALSLTSSFVFRDAAEAARRFANEEPGNIYSRFTNPTVTMFQSRLAALEGAEACVATSTGMAAVATMAMGLLSAGDHLVAARGVFGTVVPLFNQILGRFGIETTWVDLADLDAWRAALRPRTKLLFAETPSNPVCEIADIAGLAQIAREAGAILAIDNCMCSPALQRPIAHGADLVVHSATKYIDGQGRVLGGAIAGRRDLVEGPLFNFVRTAGPALSPFNAWVCLKGLETLRLRVDAHSARALELARWLEAHPKVERVHYPGLASHPQHALAMRQQSAGGGVLSFVVRGGREAAWRVIDGTRLLSITANFGDTKTTICHPATTTHGRLPPAEREAAGVVEGLVRLAAGLEDAGDVRADLERGLAAA